MFGDALIHIIPAMMGLHSHSDTEAVITGDTPGDTHEGDSHEDETALDILTEITPLVLTALWILLFFLLEKAIVRIVGHQHHNHSIGEIDIEGNELEASKTSTKTEDLPVDDTEITPNGGEQKEEKMIHPAGYLLLIGDGTHNFVDGLAIGLAFSSSFDLGLATAIAVLVHEVPQVSSYPNFFLPTLRVFFQVLMEFRNLAISLFSSTLGSLARKHCCSTCSALSFL